MFSAILSGPIWAELLSATIGKALITGGLTVIKAGPEIKKLIEDQKEDSVINVFNKDIK